MPVLTADPVVGSLPDHEPEAVQLVAFALVQFRTADCPAVMVVGLTFMSAVTAGGVALELTTTLTL